MIPQLQQQLSDLQAAFAELEKQTHSLRDNINELRGQLQVDRMPQHGIPSEMSSGPLNYLVPPSHAGRRDR